MGSAVCSREPVLFYRKGVGPKRSLVKAALGVLRDFCKESAIKSCPEAIPSFGMFLFKYGKQGMVNSADVPKWNETNSIGMMVLN